MSYYTLIELDREPFSTSPDPHFFYRSLEHQSALNRLEIAIRLKRGLSVVLGDVGTGKTTLSRALFQAFNDDPDYLFFMILDPSFNTEGQFWAYLARLLKINSFSDSIANYKGAIEKFLFQKTVAEKKTVVLVIDEGQKMSKMQLEILRTLLNYETNEYKMLQLVILGQMELFPKIKQMSNLLDRINTRFMLHPLDEYDTGQLIRFRLQQAGYKQEKDLFTSMAVRKIFEFTKGRPRKINLLCHRAMEYLVLKDLEVVTADLVSIIIEEEQVWG